MLKPQIPREVFLKTYHKVQQNGGSSKDVAVALNKSSNYVRQYKQRLLRAGHVLPKLAPSPRIGKHYSVAELQAIVDEYMDKKQ